MMNIQIINSLPVQAKQDYIIVYEFKGTRLDCVPVDGFIEATNYFYEKRK